MKMNKIKKIAREYANEYFTDEMLMSGDETWDYAAQVWFDEHYPDLSDDDRHSFATQLDRLFARRRYRLSLRKFRTMEKPVFEGMTKSELQAKISMLLKSMDFLEAKRLLDAYKSLN